MRDNITTELMNIDIGRAAFALAKALDCVGVDDVNHGSRVGLICVRIARQLGWADERCDFALLVGMVHDIGVSSSSVHQNLVKEMEWQGAQEHCELGRRYLTEFEPFREMAMPIAYHHTRWCDLPSILTLEQKQYANLVFFADRLDVALALFSQENPQYKTLQHKDELLGSLEPYVGTLFSEHIFLAAKETSRCDGFWLELQNDFLDDAIDDLLSKASHTVLLSIQKVEALCELISHIVDAKSPFTRNHSVRVADISQALARKIGYSGDELLIFRILGLLHDVGKLRMPDEILEKKGSLLPDELSQVRYHPMDGKRVLKSIFPDGSIVKWVSEHHEKLNGSGYPYGFSADNIEQPARILAIADIFQALCQKRPYRDRLELLQVIEIMDAMRDRYEIDPDIYDVLMRYKHEFYTMATLDF